MTETVAFVPWPKTRRLKDFKVVITEKIDGSNAQVHITEDGQVLAGSRKRWVYPNGNVPNPDNPQKFLKGTDNFGFAAWVKENEDRLREELGVGTHYGEWWGKGIQRHYGAEDRTFSLFNVQRWGQYITPGRSSWGLSVVPTLYSGPYDTGVVERVMDSLAIHGSLVRPTDTPSEGVIVYFCDFRQGLKVTYEHKGGKWQG